MEAEYLLLYVNEMLLISKERSKVGRMKEMLRSEFDMKDLGPVSKILGMNIARKGDKGILFLNERKYLQKLMEKFNMNGAKSPQQLITNQFQLSS